MTRDTGRGRRRRDVRAAQEARVAELRADNEAVLASGGPAAEQLYDDLYPGRHPGAVRIGTVAGVTAGVIAAGGLVLVAVRMLTG